MARVKPYEEYFIKKEVPDTYLQLKIIPSSDNSRKYIPSPSVTDSSCTEAAVLGGCKSPHYPISESERNVDSFIPPKRQKKSPDSFEESNDASNEQEVGAYEMLEQNLVTACTYPPNGRTVTILKCLSDGKNLPDADLDYALTYISFLKYRNRQSDSSEEVEDTEEAESIHPEPMESEKFRESLLPQTHSEEQVEVSDDEPPLLISSVRVPSPEPEPEPAPAPEPAPEKPESPGQYSNPDDIPHIQAVPQTKGKIPMNRDPVRMTAGQQVVKCDICGSRMGNLHFKLWHPSLCSGVILRSLDKNASDGERRCPRCDKVLACNKDFEVHMAVAHEYYWYIEFENEEEYQAWFKKEGLDETMYILSNSVYKRKKAPGVRHWTYSCAQNRGRRHVAQCECPSHMYARNDDCRFTVKYWPTHSHSQKVTRMGISLECRDMVEEMVRAGFDNKEIVEKVKEKFPKDSINQLISPANVFQVRRRLDSYCKRNGGTGNVFKVRTILKNRRKILETVDEEINKHSRAKRKRASSCVASQ